MHRHLLIPLLLVSSAFAGRSFNGTTQAIFSSNCCAVTPLSSATTVSVSAWVYETSLTGSGEGIAQMVNDQFPGFFAYGISLDSTGHPSACENSGVNSSARDCATSASTLSLNAWHHLGMTWDITSGLVRLYVDGAQAAMQATAATQAQFTLPFSVGANYSGGSVDAAFEGNIAEPAVWDVLLSAAEMSALAHGTPASLVRPSQGRNTTLFVYWPLHGIAAPEGNFADIASTVNNGGLVGAPLAAPHCGCGMPTGEGH